MPNYIRNVNVIPPGQYFIKILYRNGKEESFYGPCRETPECRLFGPSPLIEEPAKRLGAFRRANGLSRSSVAECVEDISLYTCQRIGGNPAWCFDTEQSFNQISPLPAATGGCAGCGHKLT